MKKERSDLGHPSTRYTPLRAGERRNVKESKKCKRLSVDTEPKESFSVGLFDLKSCSDDGVGPVFPSKHQFPKTFGYIA